MSEAKTALRAAQVARRVPAQIDIVLLPGVAFDQWGNRMGYGAGLPALNGVVCGAALAT